MRFGDAFAPPPTGYTTVAHLNSIVGLGENFGFYVSILRSVEQPDQLCDFKLEGIVKTYNIVIGPLLVVTVLILSNGPHPDTLSHATVIRIQLYKYL